MAPTANISPDRAESNSALVLPGPVCIDREIDSRGGSIDRSRRREPSGSAANEGIRGRHRGGDQWTAARRLSRSSCCSVPGRHSGDCLLVFQRGFPGAYSAEPTIPQGVTWRSDILNLRPAVSADSLPQQCVEHGLAADPIFPPPNVRSMMATLAPRAMSSFSPGRAFP